jgi:hypothetical protein
MTSILMAAAISGIVGGANAAPSSSPSFTSDGTVAAQQLDDSKKDGKHACKGQNGCKGQGGCKTDKHACKGQNACKGQGGCKA